MKALLLTAILGLSISGLAWADSHGADCHCEDGATAAQAEVGKPAPVFTAVDANGDSQDIAAIIAGGKIVVLEWFNPECPFVKRHYEGGASTMKDLAAKYGDKVVWLAVNSSSGQDAEFNKAAATTWEITYPIVVDQSGEIGKLYGADTTPDMFIINTDGILVYAGAIDNNAGGDVAPDAIINYVDAALQSLTTGATVTTAQTKSYGCSIKYGS